MTEQALVVIPESKELAKISVAPALIDYDFEQEKIQLAEDLKDFDVVVLPEKLNDGKKLAAELNKKLAAVTKIKKLVKEKVSENFAPFEADIGEFTEMLTNAKEKLTVQIDTCVENILKEVRKLLTERLHTQWEKHGVNEEFRKADIEKLVLQGSVTSTNALTKKAVESIESMVLADKAKQDSINTRLILLENQSLKSGVNPPLTRSHVETFLFDDDEQYQAKLDKVIAAEIERQQESERLLREKIARENAAKAPDPVIEQKEPEPTPEMPVEQPVVDHKAASAVTGSRTTYAPKAKTPEGATSEAKEYAFQLAGTTAEVTFKVCTLEEAEQCAIAMNHVGTVNLWVEEGLAAEVTTTIKRHIS